MTSTGPASSATQKLIGKWLLPLAAIVFATVLSVVISARLDLILGDVFLANNQEQPDNDIVVVAISEDTLATLPYRSPIDRGFLADLITRIDAASPKKIGLDILLDSPSEPAKDQLLSDAISNAKAPVVLATAGLENGLTKKQYTYLKAFTENKLTGTIVLHRDEIDGVVRHLPTITDASGKPIPTFADVLAEPVTRNLTSSNRILYLPKQTNGSSAFPIYPAHTATLLPADWFTDKIVLIGTVLPDTDMHPTPLGSLEGLSSGSLAGIEIHAHILSQIISERSLPTISALHKFALIALAAIFSAILFSIISSPVLFFVCLGVAVSGYAFVCWLLLSNEVLLLPIIGPVLAAVAVALLLSLIRWWEDRSQKAFLETAFSKYVSPTVVRRLTTGNIELALGGERRLVTYLFTDLEGFTGLSQTLPPDRMGELLNAYLDQMCDLITAQGATIDKIIGDAVVCFFGAPDADHDQAVNGVRLALALDKFCEEFRAEANEMGIPLGVTRIGLHMGEAIVGNFGGKRFFDYTGIGDTVNTAARLEGANRYLGTRICVSEAIAERCADVPFRPVGKLILKGRRTALPCFEPSSEATMSSPWMTAYLEAYEKLEAGNSNTMTLFQNAARLNGDDGPTRFYINRLKEGIIDTTVTLWEK